MFQSQDETIRYGDVFPVTGDLEEQPIAPRYAAMMQSAVAINEQRGAVGRSQFSERPRDQGVTVAQTDIPGLPRRRLVTEFVAGQVSNVIICASWLSRDFGPAFFLENRP